VTQVDLPRPGAEAPEDHGPAHGLQEGVPGRGFGSGRAGSTLAPLHLDPPSKAFRRRSQLTSSSGTIHTRVPGSHRRPGMPRSTSTSRGEKPRPRATRSHPWPSVLTRTATGPGDPARSPPSFCVGCMGPPPRRSALRWMGRSGNGRWWGGRGGGMSIGDARGGRRKEGRPSGSVREGRRAGPGRPGSLQASVSGPWLSQWSP
jgi:hypothetical protein